MHLAPRPLHFLTQNQTEIKIDKMASKVAILLLLLAAVAHAALLQTSQDADAYVDELLKQGAEQVERDTAELEDLDVDIEKNIFIANYVGTAKLSEGSVSGLNDASRYAPSTVVVNDDNTTSVSAFLEYKKLDAVYETAEITINGRDMTGSLRLSLKKLRVKADLTVDDNTGAVSVDNFGFRQVKNQNLKITGTGSPIFGPVYAAFDDIKVDVRGFVVDALANNFKELVQGPHEEDNEDKEENKEEEGEQEQGEEGEQEQEQGEEEKEEEQGGEGDEVEE